MNCPRCGGTHIVKNGSNGVGTPKFLCKVCGRQFVEDPKNCSITQETKELIDKLLLERIPLAGIVRVTGVSERWLQYYVNDKYAHTPRRVENKKKSRARLTLECDELWSFVARKGNKQWVWLAFDRDTQEVVGVYIGDRSQTGAQGLWQSLPAVYRQRAVSYTDFWEAYEAIFPGPRHRSVGKETGQTSHIERFNCTLRQRVSRLVRKALSFSKKLENHVGAIWYFVHHYNATLCPTTRS
ncbi:IS1 family transposase [Nitrosococcus halophilus]|uniref:IS1 family transposase n=1 Tax=Nitrosococcus halophilus TaxID=133539 RepID=UPI003B833238